MSFQAEVATKARIIEKTKFLAQADANCGLEVTENTEVHTKTGKFTPKAKVIAETTFTEVTDNTKVNIKAEVPVKDEVKLTPMSKVNVQGKANARTQVTAKTENSEVKIALVFVKKQPIKLFDIQNPCCLQYIECIYH